MSLHIMLASEANEGLGHILPWLAFIERASRLGHSVTIVSPQARVIAPIVSTYGVKLVPGWWPSMHAAPLDQHSDTWEDLLWSLGYGSEVAVSSCAKRWAKVIEQSKPDVLLADYAPLAMVVASVMGVPVVEAGGGFCLPPRLGEPPCWLPHLLSSVSRPSASAELASQRGQRITRVLNAAVISLGHKEVAGKFSDIYLTASLRCVTSTPDLDHYKDFRPEGDVEYLGMLSQSEFGVDPSTVASSWMALGDGRKRLLCYLKSTTPRIDELLHELSVDHGWQVLLVGTDSPTIERALKGVGDTPRHLSWTLRPVNFAPAIARADAFLTNGGIHSLGHALKAGVPCLLVPSQTEQAAVAFALKRNPLVSVITEPRSIRYALSKIITPTQAEHHVNSDSPQQDASAEGKLLQILTR